MGTSRLLQRLHDIDTIFFVVFPTSEIYFTRIKFAVDGKISNYRNYTFYSFKRDLIRVFNSYVLFKRFQIL